MKNCSFHFNNKSKRSLDPLAPICQSLSYTEAWHTLINAHSKHDSTTLFTMTIEITYGEWDERFETRWAFHIFWENWKFSKKIETLSQNDNDIAKCCRQMLSHGDVFTYNFEVSCKRQLWQLIFTRKESIKIANSALHEYSNLENLR